jgi:hypothetical protein
MVTLASSNCKYAIKEIINAIIQASKDNNSLLLLSLHLLLLNDEQK